MESEYAIKLSMTSHKHDNPENPFYWSLVQYQESWHQIAFGWESTPEQSFLTAMEAYRKRAARKTP